MRFRFGITVFFLTMLAIILVEPSPSNAQVQYQRIAITGEGYVDGNGEYSGFSNLFEITDVGVSFGSSLRNTAGGTNDNNAVSLWQNGTVTKLARKGESLNGFQMRGTLFARMNNHGQFALNDTFNDALYFVDGNTSTLIAKEFDRDIDNEGNIRGLNIYGVSDNGQVLYQSSIDPDPAGGFFRSKLNLYDSSNGQYVNIFREDDTVPDGDGQFQTSPPWGMSISRTGRVDFSSDIDNSAGGLRDGYGTYFYENGQTNLIGRKGTATPRGTLRGLATTTSPNNSGQTAFSGGQDGTTGGFSDDVGLFIHDPNTGFSEVLKEGDAAPGGGTFFRFGNNVDFNDDGIIAAMLQVSGVGTNDTGLFQIDGDQVTEVLMEGDAAPNGDGVFGQLDLSGTFNSQLHMNNRGQMAFLTELDGTSNGDGVLALFMTDVDGTVHEIVREGGLFDVDPTAGVDLRTVGTIEEFGSYMILNDNGDLAFSLTFSSDSSRGLFLSSLNPVPEPGSARVLLLTCGCLFSRRARPRDQS